MCFTQITDPRSKVGPHGLNFRLRFKKIEFLERHRPSRSLSWVYPGPTFTSETDTVLTKHSSGVGQRSSLLDGVTVVPGPSSLLWGDLDRLFSMALSIRESRHTKPVPVFSTPLSLFVLPRVHTQGKTLVSFLWHPPLVQILVWSF